MSQPHLQTTTCAICETEENFDILYPANFDQDSFSAEIFSARRLPDRCHYRMVKCRNCGLVRSHPVISSETLEKLYRESHFTYDNEVENLTRTYGFYLEYAASHLKAGPSGIAKSGLLEIGCGNGFLLDFAIKNNWQDVWGVEPSTEAIEKAPEHIRPNIVAEMFRSNLFPENRFNMVTLFQVFDHLPNPNAVVAEIHRILKAGGLILAINHNIDALPARILKNRSPIIDIEHTYLYDKETMAKIFVKHNFEIVEVFDVKNWHSLKYLTRLIPLPKKLKKGIISLLSKCPISPIGEKSLHIGLGNLGLIARKKF